MKYRPFILFLFFRFFLLSSFLTLAFPFAFAKAQMDEAYANEAALTQQRISTLESRIQALESRLNFIEKQQQQQQAVPQQGTRPTVYSGVATATTTTNSSKGNSASGLAVEDYGNKTTDTQSRNIANVNSINSSNSNDSSSVPSGEITPEKQKEFQKTVEQLKIKEKEKNDYIDSLMKEN